MARMERLLKAAELQDLVTDEMYVQCRRAVWWFTGAPPTDAVWEERVGSQVSEDL